LRQAGNRRFFINILVKMSLYLFLRARQHLLLKVAKRFCRVECALAFRRVATLGDGWHATSKTPAQYKDALVRLRAAADAARRPFDSIALSLRYSLKDEMLAQGTQAVVDELAEFKRLGLVHVMIDFRRDDLAKMLELLDLVTGTIRPAVERA